jgi:hypothetical protein
VFPFAAHAAGDDSGAAAAESFFQEGRKLMDAKRYSEACPKFAASQKASPAIGTLLNLADCYEKNNQHASAWVRFHEAIALAQRLNRPNREQTARDRADRLEPRLIKLTITSRAASADVKLDGTQLDPAALGTPIPIDPGKHTVEASAKGKKSFSTTIDATERQKAPSVEVPALEDESKGSESVVAGKDKDKDTRDSKDQHDSKVTEPPKEQPSPWSTQKTLAVVAGGAGVVALAVGGIFGLKTSSAWNEAQGHCNPEYECDRKGVQLHDDAQSSGNLSTALVIIGGAFVVGGVVLFFTAPSSTTTASQPSMRLGFGPGAFVLGGTFR